MAYLLAESAKILSDHLSSFRQCRNQIICAETLSQARDTLVIDGVE